MTKIDNLLNKRNKRGLINGIESIIKSITGNLDSQDTDRYEQIFTKIKENQDALQNQNLENIHLNKIMIEKFNKQIENLNHILKSRVIQIDGIVKNLFRIKEVMSQTVLMLINILELINEIVTSLTFCNLNKIHSSLINTKDVKEFIIHTVVNGMNNKLNF